MASKVQRGDRRSDSDRRADRRRPTTSPAAKEFLEVAMASLERVEQAAGDAAPSLDLELDGLIEEVAALAARVRVRLARCEAQPPAPAGQTAPAPAGQTAPATDEVTGETTEGAALLARQLARAGAVAPEIEEVLDDLGVPEPQKVVRRTLH